VVLITALGDDGHGARPGDLLGRHVEVVQMPLRGGTPCKIRIRASGRSVARLDAGNGRADPAPAGPAAERALRSAGGILVADYGRGVAAHPGLRASLAGLPGRVHVVWDPHPRGEPPLPGTRLATANEREARGFAGPARAAADAAGPPAGRLPDRLPELRCLGAGTEGTGPTAVLDRLRPDVWVKGGDYARSELAEAPVVRRYGGEVVLLPYTGHSTSRILAAALASAGRPDAVSTGRLDGGLSGPRRAGRPTTRTAGIEGGQMADVFTVLGQDHQEVKRMLAELEKGPSRVTGASEDQLALRKKMTEQLIIEESKHEALEEMYFWPVVRDHLPDGDTLADRATGQEQEAKEVLAKLDKLDAGDAEFEKLLGVFIGAAREHIAFEETAVWPGLRTALNTERAAELGTQIAEGKKTAPTRPHPHTPPGALKTAGPVAAAADKARDAVTGRGD
jgi:Hemerythrin HHE cation binding domain